MSLYQKAVESIADAFIAYAQSSPEAYDVDYKQAKNSNIDALRSITTSCFVRCAEGALILLEAAGIRVVDVSASEEPFDYNDPLPYEALRDFYIERNGAK